jgi:aminoglycoside phosphotransferase (APT) family kinase protein
MNDFQALNGGRENKVFKTKDHVIRPSGAWTPHVHRFLHFLIQEGFTVVPRPYGTNEKGEEILSFVQGEVYNDPLPEFMLEDKMIRSSARLLRRFHDVSERYIDRLTNQEAWMLSARDPIEVLCHGDFAPYNVTIVDGEAFGIIDFDTLHPGPKLWDIAYAVYRWVPISIPTNPDSRFSLEDQILKAKLFLDTYGVNAEERELLPQTMVDRLTSLVHYMKTQAENGNCDFQKNIDEGHLEIYLNDIEFIHQNAATITKGIMID